MIPEAKIRERSYFIWLAEGRPDGKAAEHWRRALAELEAEERSSTALSSDWKSVVMPRLPVSCPPNRVTSRRIPTGRAA